MNKLTSVIGLAPSELSREEFLRQLCERRRLVGEDLEQLRLMPSKKAAKKRAQSVRAKAKKADDLEAFLREKGWTMQEFLEKVKQAKT